MSVIGWLVTLKAENLVLFPTPSARTWGSWPFRGLRLEDGRAMSPKPEIPSGKGLSHSDIERPKSPSFETLYATTRFEDASPVL